MAKPKADGQVGRGAHKQVCMHAGQHACTVWCHVTVRGCKVPCDDVVCTSKPAQGILSLRYPPLPCL